MTDDTQIELRSEEVQEILTRVPSWMIRWGSIVILLIVLLLFLVSYLVKYPEVIVTQVVITTNTPPQKLVAKTSGNIEVIFVKDRGDISKNAPLAVIQNSANYEDVFKLKKILDTFDLNNTIFPFEDLASAELGEIESSYSLFQKEYIAEQLNTELKPYKVEGNAQTYESVQLKERLKLLESQKDITENELELQKLDLDRHESLFKKGIIAAQEFEKQRLLYLQSQKNYRNVLSTISQLKSSLNELERSSKTTKINESKEDVNLERNVIQAFFQLKKAVKD